MKQASAYPGDTYAVVLLVTVHIGGSGYLLRQTVLVELVGNASIAGGGCNLLLESEKRSC